MRRGRLCYANILSDTVALLQGAPQKNKINNNKRKFGTVYLMMSFLLQFFETNQTTAAAKVN